MRYLRYVIVLLCLHAFVVTLPFPWICRHYTPKNNTGGLALLRHFHSKVSNYSIASGTALGLRRHGKLIPWDDDLDVVVPYFNRSWFTYPYCTTTFWGGWKLYRCDSTRTRYEWNYPFLDIFRTDNNAMSAEIMFPSVPVRMNGMEVLRPHDMDEHLRLKYGSRYMKDCLSPYWDHVNERALTVYNYSCRAIDKLCL